MSRRRAPFLAVACVLALSARARAQHAGDMLIASSAAGGGVLTLQYDFTKRVAVFESASGGGNVLYASTDPGWDLLVDAGAGVFPLAGGTSVSVEITAIDPGVSLKIGPTTLDAAGESRLLGTAPATHVHPAWQLVLPAGVQGERTVSFRMTTTSAAYAPSATYTAVLSNTTTTTSPETTTTTLAATTSTTTVGGGASTTSTTAAGPTVTSTTQVPSSTTSTTTPTASTAGEPLHGDALTIRTHRRTPRIVLVSRDGGVMLSGTAGGAGDPTVHGGTVRLTSPSAGFDDLYELPARNWRRVSKRGVIAGWRYADPKALAGPITGVTVKAGRRLALTGRGAALGVGLAANPEPVSVTIAAGEQRWCLRFGGSVRWKAGASFTARQASAPVECTP